MSDTVLSGENIAAQAIEAITTMMAPEAVMVAASSVKEEDSARFDFPEDFQAKLVAFCLRDSEFLARVDGLLKPQYFERAVDGTLASLALNYYAKYRRCPDRSVLGVLIKSAVEKKQIRRDLIEEIKGSLRSVWDADIGDREFVVEQVEVFAQQRAWEAAILKSAELLDKRDFDQIKKEIEAAALVGANDDLGAYDYFANIEARTIERNERAAGLIPPKGITTGIKALDDALMHQGWGRRELSVIMGPAKAGKSMALLEFSKNAALKGFNSLYITLEVDSEVLADRLDANLSNYMMKELTHKGSAVEEQVKRIMATAGKFLIHRYAPGSFTPGDLRRLLRRYKAKGVVFDLVTVDYGDLMAPDFRTRDNPIEDSKNVWVGLRAVAVDEGIAVLTATQTNRDGAKASVAKATDVAEDFNKIRIADIVISINRTDEEKLRNEARLHFAASRNQGDAFSLRINQDLERGRFITRVLGLV